jgi:hypothetical protein
MGLSRSKEKKTLIQSKNTNSSNGQGRDERHNPKVKGWIHSRETKIADLVGEQLQIKEKIRMEKW